MLASASYELARKVRLASGDDLTVIGARQVPAGPGQLLGLVPDPDSVRTVLLDVEQGQVPVEQALDLARRMEQHRPGVGVLLVSSSTNGLALEALRAGVHDLVDPGASVEDLRVTLRGAVEASARRVNPAVHDSSVTGGRVICVASPKGGVGKTTVATNIALDLASQSHQGTVLLDFDIQFGDVAAALNLSPTYTLGDMVAGGNVPDLMGLKALLTQHPSGLQVVCGVKSPIDADGITAPGLSQLIHALKSEFKYVVIDTSPGLSEQTLAALDHTTDLVLVASLDVPGVRGLRKELEVLDELHLPPSTRHVVVNFADRAGGLSTEDVEATLGRKVDYVLPRSTKVVRSTNQGVPMVTAAPRDKVSKSLRDLTARFAPLARDSSGPNGRHRGWRKS